MGTFPLHITHLFVCRFGILHRIITDNGPQFRVPVLKSFYEDYGIQLALASIYAPQMNDQAESANKIILWGLKNCVLAAQINWVDELNKLLWSCWTTPSLATRETPFSLSYGIEAVIPIEIGMPSPRIVQFDDLIKEQNLKESIVLIEETRDVAWMWNIVY